MPDPTETAESLPAPAAPAPMHAPAGGVSLWPFGVGVVLLLLAGTCFYKIAFAPSENQFLIGVFMLVGGIAEGIHAIFGRAWRDFIGDLAPALLYVLCGMIILADPLTGSFVLTLILAAALVTGAVYRVVASWRDRPLTGWQTLGAAVVVSILVWLFLLWTWPRSGIWVLGTVAGVGLLVTGISWIRRGLSAREAHEQL
ncbi:MAG: DUF308 domain-containing protein [Alsobacter sp.]